MSKAKTSEDVRRCGWSIGVDLARRNATMIAYHDREWGVPVHDDRKHFEYMVLDAFQAGLSWAIVLAKRDGFRRAFADFDPERIARFNVKSVERLVGEVERSPARTPAAIRLRLREQVGRLLEAGATLDEPRLYQEAALLAARTDVEEELKRLAAHVAAARELLASKEPAGRRLDFLAQEFNREANTLCSKAYDEETTRTGLELKATIDDLEPDQQMSLVGLMWLGRGDYEAAEWERALSDARERWTARTADYLIGTPLLADYLADGLEQLGYAPE